MTGKRYTIKEIEQWAERYKYSLSFADVGKIFGVYNSTVKHKFCIKFKDEVQNELYSVGKRLCLPTTGCGKIKSIVEFYFKKDSGKYKEQCIECRSRYNKKME